MISIIKPNYDAIVVGAGFGGCHVLQTLREKGYKTLVLDDGADLGGVWYWNSYPGARVDSKVPLYEFSNENIWSDWTWSEKYPGREEIQSYFHHVESKLHLKKDIRFSTRVTSAEFDENSNQWIINTSDGTTFTARYFILCTGFAAKHYIPAFKGLDSFTGIKYHTSKWPQTGIDYDGKKVGVVGNGSSGLQVIQEIAPGVGHLTVFQRSPTYALPMKQTKLSKGEQDKSKYGALFKKRATTFAGIDQEFNPQSALEVSEDERQRFFEETWEEGGLAFWLANYQDVIMNKVSNRHAYDFWRSKVVQRIKNPTNAEILAPENPPYFFGTKRATLEQRYYEVYDQENVNLINATANPIEEIVSNGAITKDGTLHELDILILATGFDSVTGGILAIDIKGVDRQSLQEKWANGTWTSLGLTTAGFPNMFFLYGPQGPTSFCNGPTCAEIQGDWIASTIDFMKESNFTRINANAEAEKAWKEQVEGIGNMSLLPFTKSEYMGTNIPGKPKEMLNYLGGLPRYVKQINEAIETGFPGYELA